MDEVISIALDEEEDKGFLQHIYSVHGFADAYSYSELFWSVLHEVGHYCTENCLETHKGSDNSVYEYYEQDVEWNATEWAIDYILCHQKLSNFLSKFI